MEPQSSPSMINKCGEEIQAWWPVAQITTPHLPRKGIPLKSAKFDLCKREDKMIEAAVYWTPRNKTPVSPELS